MTVTKTTSLPTFRKTVAEAKEACELYVKWHNVTNGETWRGHPPRSLLVRLDTRHGENWEEVVTARLERYGDPLALEFETGKVTPITIYGEADFGGLDSWEEVAEKPDSP